MKDSSAAQECMKTAQLSHRALVVTSLAAVGFAWSSGNKETDKETLDFTCGTSYSPPSLDWYSTDINTNDIMPELFERSYCNIRKLENLTKLSADKFLATVELRTKASYDTYELAHKAHLDALRKVATGALSLSTKVNHNSFVSEKNFKFDLIVIGEPPPLSSSTVILNEYWSRDDQVTLRVPSESLFRIGVNKKIRVIEEEFKIGERRRERRGKEIKREKPLIKSITAGLSPVDSNKWLFKMVWNDSGNIQKNDMFSVSGKKIVLGGFQEFHSYSGFAIRELWNDKHLPDSPLHEAKNHIYQLRREYLAQRNEKKASVAGIPIAIEILGEGLPLIIIILYYYYSMLLAHASRLASEYSDFKTTALYFPWFLNFQGLLGAIALISVVAPSASVVYLYLRFYDEMGPVIDVIVYLLVSVLLAMAVCLTYYFSSLINDRKLESHFWDKIRRLLKLDEPSGATTDIGASRLGT